MEKDFDEAHNQNIFKNEKISQQRLKEILNTRIIFNNDQNPLIEVLNTKNDQTEKINQFDKGQFQDYDCIQRLLILVQRDNYIKSGESQLLRFSNIGNGDMIDHQNQIQFQLNNPNYQRQIMVLDQQNSQRPSQSQRLQSIPFKSQNIEPNQCENNLEKNIQEKSWEDDLGLEFFKNNGQKHPSIKQIFDGIIIEMKIDLINQFRSKQTEDQIETGVQTNYQTWKYIFDCLKLDINSNEQIKGWSQHDSLITKSILYIYSLETFLPYLLNKTERTKDNSKLFSLGPFACALRNITRFAQSKRNQIDQINSLTPVYRGVKLPINIFNEYRDKLGKDEFLVLDGFQSTSFSEKVAFSFMFRDLKNDEEVPVLFRITNLNQRGFQFFNMDSQDYSNFTNEKEILLETGLTFRIIQISEQEYSKNKKYFLFQLQQYQGNN